MHVFARKYTKYQVTSMSMSDRKFNIESDSSRSQVQVSKFVIKLRTKENDLSFTKIEVSKRVAKSSQTVKRFTLSIECRGEAAQHPLNMGGLNAH